MNTINNFHTPVLKQEAIAALNVQRGHWYIDCNFGGGGHAKDILGLGGNLVGFDLDKEAIEKAISDPDFKPFGDSLILVNDNFSKLSEVLKTLNIPVVSGVLFDLGVSSHQLESAGRGFSINLDAPLDMRMDRNSSSLKAGDLVNGLNLGELIKLFQTYGEESFSRPIAKKIIERRKISKIETTRQLAEIVASAKYPSMREKIHPATKVFQALRIAVNDELNSLKETLPQAFEVLDKGGRLAVISFQSLEDRVVKNYFRDLEEKNLARNLFKKPIEASEKELSDNPRSRSGKLRCVEKL